MKKYLNYTALQLSKNEVPKICALPLRSILIKAIVNYEAEQTLL